MTALHVHPAPPPKLGTKQRLNLPWPVSVNRLYRKGKGNVYLSEEGRSYKDAVKLKVRMLVRSSGLGYGKARVGVYAECFGPHQRYDVNNIEKVLWDALEGGGLYDNDRQIDYQALLRGPVDKANPHVELTIWELA